MTTPTPFSPLRRLLAAAAVGLLLAAPGASASGDEVLRDCVAGNLKSTYSPADYRDALANMPTDLDEYSDCRDQITAAQRASRTGGGSGPSAATQKRFAAIVAGGGSAGSGDAGGGGAIGDDGAPLVTPAPAAAAGLATTPPVAMVRAVSNPAVSGLPASNPWPVGSSRHIPFVPVTIALAVIGLGVARMMVLRGRRPEPEAMQ